MYLGNRQLALKYSLPIYHSTSACMQLWQIDTKFLVWHMLVLVSSQYRTPTVATTTRAIETNNESARHQIRLLAPPAFFFCCLSYSSARAPPPLYMYIQNCCFSTFVLACRHSDTNGSSRKLHCGSRVNPILLIPPTCPCPK
jgi:hypothetical protein